MTSIFLPATRPVGGRFRSGPLTSGESFDSLPAESKDRSQVGAICLPDDCCFSSCTCSPSPLAVELSAQTPRQNMHVMHSRLRLLAALFPRSVNILDGLREVWQHCTQVELTLSILVYTVFLRNTNWAWSIRAHSLGTLDIGVRSMTVLHAGRKAWLVSGNVTNSWYPCTQQRATHSTTTLRNSVQPHPIPLQSDACLYRLCLSIDLMRLFPFPQGQAASWVSSSTPRQGMERVTLASRVISTWEQSWSVNAKGSSSPNSEVGETVFEYWLEPDEYTITIEKCSSDDEVMTLW